MQQKSERDTFIPYNVHACCTTYKRVGYSRSCTAFLQLIQRTCIRTETKQSVISCLSTEVETDRELVMYTDCLQPNHFTLTQSLIHLTFKYCSNKMQMCRDNRLNMCNGDVSLDPATSSPPKLCCKQDTARSHLQIHTKLTMGNNQRGKF